MPELKRKPKCIGIVGTRRRNSVNDGANCYDGFIKHYRKGDSIVSGGCPKGGDRFAEQLARQFGLTITIHHPETDGGGLWIHKGAGLERNTKIAEQCDILIAVVAEDRTGGTEDTIRKCEALGKPVYII